MLYQLNNAELEQIAKIYEIDIETLAERLNFEDRIISFLPHEGGVAITTENNQNLILRFEKLML